MQNDLIENLEFKICLKVSEIPLETLQSILIVFKILKIKRLF